MRGSASSASTLSASAPCSAATAAARAVVEVGDRDQAELGNFGKLGEVLVADDAHPDDSEFSVPPTAGPSR